MDMNLFTSDNDRIIVRHTSLEKLHNRPLRLSGGAIIYCISGHATVSLNMCEYDLSSDIEIFILPGSVVALQSADPDFEAITLSFSRSCFEEANFRIESQFFHYIHNHPRYKHTDQSAEIARKLFDVMVSIYEDRDNRFREMIMIGHLRNILLTIYDKVQRMHLQDTISSDRREELFHKFIDMIMENCKDKRDVRWYAESMCISKSYLAGITRSVAAKTPKQIIDEHIVQEIKIMLSFSDNTIQYIADTMHFPDQSYLGRFFKHHTSQSPSEYRQQISAALKKQR